MSRVPRASVALIAVLTLAVVGGFVHAVGYVSAISVGGVGVVLLAGVLQVQTADRYRLFVGVGTALAMPLVGGAILVSTGDVLADQIRADAPPGAVTFVASVLVAVFGATLTPRGPLDRTSLVRTLGIGIRVVLLLAGTIAVFAIVQFTPLGEFLAVVSEAAQLGVFDPPAGAVFLGSWLALIALAVGGLAAALRSLPVTELVAEPDRCERIERGTRYLALSAVPLAAAALISLSLEAVGDPYAGLPAGVRAPLAGLTGLTALRWLLVLVAVGTLLPAIAARLLKQGYRTDARSALVTAGPYIGSALVVVRALGGSGDLVAQIRAGLVARLPEPARPGFEELADDLVAFYGEQLLALGIVFVVVSITVVVVGLLTVGLLLSLVPEHNSGPVLAGSGIFATGVFAVVLGAPLWAGMAGAVTGMVVLDAGEFGTTLSRELGTVSSARTELLHAGGSASVGAVIGLAGLTLAWAASGLPAGSGPPVAALVAALVGAALLVVASR